MTPVGAKGRRIGISDFLRRREVVVAAGLSLVLALTFPAVQDRPPFQAIEGHMTDLRFRLRGPETVGRDVVIVAIDDRTVNELGRWPFSRSWLAEAVDRLSAAGARTIVFDLLFVGAEAGGAAGEARRRVPADRALADAIAAAGNVVVPYAFVFDEREANVAGRAPAIERAAYRAVRIDAATAGARAVPHAAGILAPLGPILAAGSPAHITVFLEPDGSLRRAFPAIRYGGEYYPSLPVEAARLFLGLSRDRLALDVGGGLRMGDRFVPTDPDTSWTVNYAGPAGTFETLSLVDVVRGNVAPDAVRGRVVLIGATAVGVGDRFATPYAPQLAGVEAFANVLSGILSRGFLDTASWIPLANILAVFLAGVIATALSCLGRPVVALVSVAVFAAVLSAGNLYAFAAAAVLLNATFPLLAIVLASGIAMAGGSVRDRRLRRSAERQRERVSRYVPPIAARYLEGGEGFSDSGETRMAAVMFVDLVGFTGSSEAATPARIAETMSHFHRIVERVTGAHGGTVDKYIGDAVLAVFGLSSGRPSSAADALSCGRQVAGEIAAWSRDRQSRGEAGISCGIGIHFGPLTVAEVGGEAHRQITVTGDTVNVASRLEAMTREAGAAILASDAAIEAARAAGPRDATDTTAGFEPMPVQSIRGRERLLGVWALRPSDPAAPIPSR